MRIDLNIPLKEKQAYMYNMLMSRRYREFLFYGASRSGKTFVIVYFLIVQCIVYGANCLVLRKTFQSLLDGMLSQTVPAVLKAIATHNKLSSIDVLRVRGVKFCRYINSKQSLIFYNGHYIKFFSMMGKNSKDASSKYDTILSTEWGHIFADEISELTWQPISKLYSRLCQLLKDNFPNYMLFALNPSLKSHWNYKRFFKHEEIGTNKSLPKSITDRFFVIKFSMGDNDGNISSEYRATLENASRMDRKRFLDGDYYDESEGEIFTCINWGKLPDWESFRKLLIYIDPSAKDTARNDYKAVVLLGITNNSVWLIGVYAVQGSTYEMLEGLYDLYMMPPYPPDIVIENKQIPFDFEDTITAFEEEKGVIFPIEKDNRNNGNKFLNIESTLEPMFRNHRFWFNEEMRDTEMGDLAVDQFINFSYSSNEKDDIPDAVAKGTSLINRYKITHDTENRKISDIYCVVDGQLIKV